MCSRITWIFFYLLLVLAPVLLLLSGKMPDGSGFWWDLSMALGFTGMSMMGLQFILTARFRHASAPFGIDIIYYFHRYIAVVAILLLLSHYLIVKVNYSDVLNPFNPLDAPWHMTAGRIALLLFSIIVISSLWRKRWHLDYDLWRVMHIFLALGGFQIGRAHV